MSVVFTELENGLVLDLQLHKNDALVYAYNKDDALFIPVNEDTIKFFKKVIEKCST